MCSSTAESAPKEETIASSPGSSSIAWRSTAGPSISSNMPLSAMMPSARSLSRFGSALSAAALAIAIECLLERGLAQPAEGVDEALAFVPTLAQVEIDQPLDGRRHLIRHEAGPEDGADRSRFGAVAADGDLVELGALLLDAEDADVA